MEKCRWCNGELNMKSIIVAYKGKLFHDEDCCKSYIYFTEHVDDSDDVNEEYDMYAEEVSSVDVGIVSQWGNIKLLLTELGWEYDRMSKSGQQTYDRLMEFVEEVD